MEFLHANYKNERNYIMRVLASFLLSIILASCATNNNWHWEKSGASAQDFNTDQGQCNAQAFANPYSSLLHVAIIQNQCLIGKGWRQVKNGETQSNSSNTSSDSVQELTRKVPAWGNCSFDFDCKTGLTCQAMNSLRPNGTKVCRNTGGN
jgi:hypothetical protein